MCLCGLGERGLLAAGLGVRSCSAPCCVIGESEHDDNGEEEAERRPLKIPTLQDLKIFQNNRTTHQSATSTLFFQVASEGVCDFKLRV